MSPDRQRLLLAAGLGGFLVAAVAVVLLLGGGSEEREFAAAPPECIESWNADAAAISYGQHQSGAHDYYEVEVTNLGPDGSELGGAEQPRAGTCAVVFAASALDPEPVSAAQILRGEVWTPLSELAAVERLTELQQQAQSDYNAQVTPEGTIEALE